MKNFKKSKTKTPEYFSEESFVFVFFPTVPLSCQCGMSKMLKVSKMKNFKKSKTKTSKTKTPEYFSEESFVFIFFPTVHLSCQCEMSKKC